MSRITYYPERYKCPTCGEEQRHIVGTDEIAKKKHKCLTPGCKTKLTVQHIVEVVAVQAPGIMTMTKNRIVMDRRARSHAHFVREVLPTLPKGSDERRHHMQKNGYKATD